ncbi:MoaD/ThiS family protein [Marmoricola endophyticus]|uniref:MoaD/ThiS family protein n=1 Tax=Marmoricola endophyticus TaxID=2040280 RepID=UPI00166F0840|nr:MoaD/ThiS family protein [Marmoricola endophyticus]
MNEGPNQAEGAVTVRYWASARAAAGTEADVVEVDGATTLAEVVRRVVALHDDEAFTRVVGVCSVLVEDRPAGKGDLTLVPVEPGQTVQLLPPFAGG